MIILISNEGQMCNQLVALASAYVLGIEYNEKVICPIVDQNLMRNFEFNSDNGNFIFCHSLLVLLANNLVKKCLPNVKNAQKKYDVKRKGKIQIFWNWSLQDTNIFNKHTKEIRKCFAFKNEVMRYAKNVIVRKNDEIIIGVHMRRGDYKTYNNGIWYYYDDEYIEWMKNLSIGRNVKYYLASNEAININRYLESGLNVEVLNGDAVQDLCSLSLCDYIMGPPSTFSWWAALYGGKRIMIIDEKGKKYSWNDFHSTNL